MPIRFRCPHCQQRLSIGTHKTGSLIDCPTCKEKVKVPDDAEESSGVGHLSPISPSIPSTSQNVSVETRVDSPATSFETPRSENVASERPYYAPRNLLPPNPPSAPLWISKLDSSQVTVPRYVIYSQGLLLGAVAVVCLIIGIFLGRAFSPTTSPIDPATMPCIVRGRVEYEDSQGNRLPDMGAVILALPVARQPEKSISSEGLGVDDPEPKAEHPGLRELETIGGKIARVDPAGKFELRVPRGGEFYLVAISKQARRGEDPHQPKITSTVGKYIGPATKLLGEHRYLMQEPVLREERNIDFVFTRSSSTE